MQGLSVTSLGTVSTLLLHMEQFGSLEDNIAVQVIEVSELDNLPLEWASRRILQFFYYFLFLLTFWPTGVPQPWGRRALKPFRTRRCAVARLSHSRYHVPGDWPLPRSSLRLMEVVFSGS